MKLIKLIAMVASFNSPDNKLKFELTSEGDFYLVHFDHGECVANMYSYAYKYNNSEHFFDACIAYIEELQK